jgi:chloramphenicol-sensitive protein RarD
VSKARLGVVYGIAAYGLWGLTPLFWPLLDGAGEIEALAHRIVWSVLVVGALLAVTRGFGRVRALNRRSVLLLGVAAAVITVNWGTYIWSVLNGYVIEVSLGYFINPLVTVLLGVVVLRERLRPVQWVAVGIAFVAVAVLTIDYGRPPWVALIVAFSFGTYGLIKKKVNVGAVEGLGVETALLLGPAAVFLVVLEANGSGTFTHAGLGTDLLFVGAGLVTAVPLLFFSAAAIRVPLTTIGLLQYIAPILQFAIGVLVFREDVPPVRLAGFALVWAALAALTAESLAHRRRRMRDLMAAAAVLPAEPQRSLP